MTQREAKIKRVTRETKVGLVLNLDGTGVASLDTGFGFVDHMLTALATHGRLDLTLKCDGDSEVDDHHTIEDCAIVLGEAVKEALGDKRGIRRFASEYAPLDESLARVVLDISGRPFASVNLSLKRDSIGKVACENIAHFFSSFAMSAGITMHVDIIRGENDHHKSEAAFKAFAQALRAAVSLDSSSAVIPSTKGVL
jgi:imidazoleglycerol phosphate dehydratase HisB